jgi:hypothetical protein
MSDTALTELAPLLKRKQFEFNLYRDRREESEGCEGGTSQIQRLNARLNETRGDQPPA